MGFDAGAMISAVAYELIPMSVVDQCIDIALAFLFGSLVYYGADRIVETRGGKNRQEIDSDEQGGSGTAMFIGALLDGVPEGLCSELDLQLAAKSALPSLRQFLCQTSLKESPEHLVFKSLELLIVSLRTCGAA
jgi:ZIP family zinc transporter